MKKPIIIGFYGYSDSGKTHLITRLIKKLNEDKINIACIKITPKDIHMDLMKLQLNLDKLRPLKHLL